MPQLSYSTPPMVASPLPLRSRRRRGIASNAAAVATAVLLLVSCPSSTHAATGLLRGESPQLPQHAPNDVDPKEASSLNDVEGIEASAQEERVLADHGDVVTINPFTVNLLATNFPYQMKYSSDNQLSSAVSGYLATYLDDTLNSSVDNLGVSCTRSTVTIGQEARWRLTCDGGVTFDGDESDDEVNGAIRNAFRGSNKNTFLEIIYPNYEMVHEKNEYDMRFSSLRTARHRGGRKGGKKKTNQKKKANGNNKRKNKGKRGKKKKSKRKNKPKKMNGQMTMMMKPHSSPAGGSGGGGGGGGKNGLNIMGYVSGSQQMQQYSGKNVDKNGNIIVNLGP